MGVWIASEEVMDKVILSPVLARVGTELLEAMVKLSSVGAVTIEPNGRPVGGAVNSATGIAGDVTEDYVQAHRSLTVAAHHFVGCTPCDIVRTSHCISSLTGNAYGGCLDSF